MKVIKLHTPEGRLEAEAFRLYIRISCLMFTVIMCIIGYLFIAIGGLGGVIIGILATLGIGVSVFTFIMSFFIRYELME